MERVGGKVRKMVRSLNLRRLGCLLAFSFCACALYSVDIVAGETVLGKKVDSRRINATVGLHHNIKKTQGKFPHHAGRFHEESKLTKEQLERLERFRTRRKRAPFVFMFLLFVMVVVQVLLWTWRKTHYYSYQQTTLAGLLLFPFIFADYFHFWRFVAVWAMFLACTGYHVWLATRNPLDVKTPRRVYTWFFRLYKICYVMSVGGYVGVILEFLGIRAALFLPRSFSGHATIVLFYGLYFGLLGRDCAELCAWRMKQALGYSKKDDDEPQRMLPTNMCALCAGQLGVDTEALIEGQDFADDSLHNHEQRSITREERIVKLKCGHEFHEFCLRGWVIVGKNHTCPNCGDKVNIRSVLGMTPWESQSLVWAQLLDALRYLIVWNPIIFMLTQGTLYEIGF